jgi:hypothetical protein
LTRRKCGYDCRASPGNSDSLTYVNPCSLARAAVYMPGMSAKSPLTRTFPCVQPAPVLGPAIAREAHPVAGGRRNRCDDARRRVEHRRVRCRRGTGVAEGSALLAVQSYALVIGDWKLPDGEGSFIADMPQQLGAKTVLMSGYAHDMPPEVREGHPFMMKLVRIGPLLSQVSNAIGGPNLA